MIFISSKAIVINTINYSDSKKIVTLYSQERGLISAIVSGNKKYSQISLLEPLSVVDITLRQSRTSLFYLNDILPHYILSSIPFDAQKRLTALFIAEVIYRTIKEQHQDKSLYSFIENSIIELDNSKDNNLNFSLVFLIQYGRCLGIYPNIDSYHSNSFFDMQHGIFCREMPFHQYFISPEYSHRFFDILQKDYASISSENYTKEQTILMLDMIISFLKLHIIDFKNIKSIEVLRQLF